MCTIEMSMVNMMIPVSSVCFEKDGFTQMNRQGKLTILLFHTTPCLEETGNAGLVRPFQLPNLPSPGLKSSQFPPPPLGQMAD